MTISAIIPVLNEEKSLGALLDQLGDIDLVFEIIVVDGGSIDKTIEVAKRKDNVTVVESEKGRALQMNAGAERASSEYLLFLHADSKLSEGLIHELPSMINVGRPGAFTLSFDQHHWLYKLYSSFSRLNWSLFTYGDQGLFMPSSLFHKLGGFSDLPIMEDLDMVRRIKSKADFCKYPAKIITSSRRFEKNGIVKQQILNIILVAAFYFGASPQFLSRFYRY